MHIPPYYKRPGWQRFFVGIFFGALAGYLVVIFMHNTMYEKLKEENYQLQSKVNDLQKQKDALEEDEDPDEKINPSRKVEAMDIRIVNAEELKLDPLLTHQITEKIKEDLDQLIGLEVDIVEKSSELIVSTIQGKTYHVEDFTYTFKVTRVVVSSKLKLTLVAEISD